MVDDAVGIQGNHCHLPGDLQVGQHFSDGLGSDHIGIAMFLDVILDFRRRFVVGNDVEIDTVKFAGNWVKRL